MPGQLQALAIYIPVPGIVLLVLVAVAIVGTLVSGLISIFGKPQKKNDVSERFFDDGA